VSAPKIHFILSAENCQQSRLDLLGTLLQTFLAAHRPCFCYVADQAYADFLDDYLWSDQFGFLPHTQDKFSDTFCQVTIGTNIADADGCSYLFNCTGKALPDASLQQGMTCIEWVSQQPHEKAQMRTLFKQYQSQQMTPTMVRM
jgi:DNA polymerase IIIc chi subunit